MRWERLQKPEVEENQRFGFGHVKFEMPTRHLTQYIAGIQEAGNQGRGLG